MARKDDVVEEEDGYRPGRGKQAKAAAPQAGSTRGPERKITNFEAFMEAHWESWLRPVLLIVAIGLGVLGYMWHLLPETFTALVLAAGVLIAAIYTTVEPTLQLITNRNQRLLFLALAAVWAFSSGYPALRKVRPAPVLGEAVISEARKPVKVQVQGGGPYDLVVSGDIKPENGQESHATYDLTVTGQGGGSETVTGELAYLVHTGRTRKGSTHWAELNDQKVYPLPPSISGPELTLSAEDLDSTLRDGLHVRILAYDPIDRLLMPRIAGVEVPVVGILVVILMMLVEARVGNSRDKTHLVMASLLTLVFSYQFYHEAKPMDLVPPAVGAVFIGMLLGGIGGGALGWLVRRLSGRDKIKPPKSERGKGRPGDEYEED